RILRQVDFTDPDQPGRDIVVIVQGIRLYVSKQLLSIHSLYFHTMFYGDFVEKSKNEIELKDLDFSEFIKLLKVIYPPSKEITDENVECLLKLSDPFDIDWLLCKCEEYLISSSNLELADKLALASPYRLAKLQDHCIDQLNTIEEVQRLK
ncbi:hypothetical protein PENTCL1PPCAC_3658, partial [Pristionchus entomophagus]